MRLLDIACPRSTLDVALLKKRGNILYEIHGHPTHNILAVANNK